MLDGVPGDWPPLLGYNQVTPKPAAQVLAYCGTDPLLAVGSHGVGRGAAFASDCAPHWCPPGFMDWPGYDPLWANLLRWLRRRHIRPHGPVTARSRFNFWPNGPW